MIKKIFILLFVFSSLSSFAQIKEYNYNQFEPLLHKQNDSVYVVNFWATWCAPCVKELPYFEKLNQKYKGEKVKVLLVSLDFARHKDSRLIPFIEKHNIQSEVVFLNDPNANAWIDKVDPNWSGAIPFTLIYSNNKRKGYEQSFTFDSLEEELLIFLKK
jgi:thiol-disulfide isomerase/thioredoxin